MNDLVEYRILAQSDDLHDLVVEFLKLWLFVAPGQNRGFGSGFGDSHKLIVGMPDALFVNWAPQL
jgi:hypothetical protein